MYMAPKVAAIDTGRVRLEMIVAVTLRRKTKITPTTSAKVSHSVNLTSLTDSRIDNDRSVRSSRITAGGSCSLTVGNSALTASTTATTLVPGCFRIARLIL